MTTSTTPPLRSLVRDLGRQHDVRIRWNHGTVSTAVFNPVIEVITPAYWGVDTYSVQHDGQDIPLKRAHNPPGEGQRFGIDGMDLVLVQGRCIHLLADLEGFHSYPGGQTFKRLADAAFEQAVPVAARFIQDYTWETEQQQFVRWRTYCTERRLSEWSQNLRDNDHEVDDLARRITSLVRYNKELRQRLTTTRELLAGDVAKDLRKEFQSLVSMTAGTLEAIDTSCSLLRLHFAPVTLMYDGEDHDMGRYKVVIDGNTVRIQGDGHREYPHPHVARDGTPCWGNLAPAIARLLGEGEFAGLVATIRMFLGSYNPNDAYVGIENWA